jgi:trehalose utilization protein
MAIISLHGNKQEKIFMALTGKERQQKYREKLKEKQAKKLDMYIPIGTHVMLESLSLHGDVSKRDYLIGLIENEYSRKIRNI